MAKKLLLRFDADDRIGTGHLVRCRSLAREARRQGFEAIFAVKLLHKSVERMLREDREEYITIPLTLPWSEEAAHLARIGADEIGCAIFDISTIYAFKDLPGVSDYFNSIRRHWSVILLDGMWNNSLAGKVDAEFDIVVAPYVGARALAQRKARSCLQLTGPRYFVAGSEYESVVQDRREIRDSADKLLVSFGGSDPNSVTSKVLDALSMITDRVLDVRVVAGLVFNPDLTSQLERKARAMRHNCEVIQSPHSLNEHMFWCDVAVSGSGLTKYELALTGTPSLQISMDEEHARVNKPFAETGASQHLGIWHDLSVEYIRHAIVGLMKDKRRRERMRDVGQHMVDTRGAMRIIEEVRRLLNTGLQSPQSPEG